MSVNLYGATGNPVAPFDVESGQTAADASTPLVGQQKKPCCSLKVKVACVAVSVFAAAGSLALAYLASSPCGSGEKYVENPSNKEDCFCAFANSTLAACAKPFNPFR